ncbi:tRNA synthetase class I family protein [Raphanus sativus]|nr:tRNA synthetase class I family protein [Raphanus sativus]
MRVDEQLKEQMLESTEQTHWVPNHVKDKRFHNWLENARDWCISRSRFWGTPLPIWISDDREEVVVMDSVEKLEKLSGVKVFDLHRHHIDQITIPSSRGPEFGVLRRVEDVFDCWFESGSMPYAYIHYPFENKELFEKNFPGDFVAEGLDQTRGCPFTPFFTETLYQNLRKACEGSEESIHYCSFPEAEETRVEKRIEQSVARMMTVIDLARNIRERHKLPLKTPLMEITVVHPDAEFLDDITGKLREYVLEELNVRSLVACNDTMKYASLKAEPDFSVLGKRLGKSMGLVGKEVKEMSQQDILRFEEAGEVTIAGHTLELTDIKIVKVFKRPDGLKDTEIDANGDGDVSVLLNLRPDDSLYEAGVAREIVNRIQNLRKKAGLEPKDFVEVYIESLDKDESALQQVLSSQEQYIKDTIGSSLLSSTLMPTHAVILSDESFQNVSKLSFKIRFANCSSVFEVQRRRIFQKLLT